MIAPKGTLTRASALRCTARLTADILERLPCEGFGCAGKGVAWSAWAICYAAALLLERVGAQRLPWGG